MNTKILLLLCISFSITAMERKSPSPTQQTVAVIANESDDTPLMQALSDRNTTEILSLLKQPTTEINAINKNGTTALMIAALLGHQTTIIERLIEAGADVNQAGSDGKTTLMFAALMGHDDIVDCLIENKADVNLLDKGGSTALMFAAVSGNPEIIQLLIQTGANVNAQDKIKGRTPLHWAQRMCEGAVHKKRSLNPINNVIQIIKILLNNGADATILDSQKMTALDWAQYNNQETLIALLEPYTKKQCAPQATPSPDIFPYSGPTCPSLSNPYEIQPLTLTQPPLIQAAIIGDVHRLSALVSGQQQEINQTDSTGTTALMHAIINGHERFAHLLLFHDAHVNNQNQLGNTALIYATMHGRLGLVKILLLTTNANVFLANSQGLTALSFTVHGSKIYRRLLKAQAQQQGDCTANATNNIQLIQASRRGDEYNTLRLLNLKANVNYQNSEGNTALMAAARYGHTQIVNLLIQAGAEIDKQNSKKQTALMLATHNGKLEVVRILLEYKANVYIEDIKNKTAFSIATKKKFPIIAQLLLESGTQPATAAQPFYSTNNCTTPLTPTAKNFVPRALQTTTPHIDASVFTPRQQRPEPVWQQTQAVQQGQINREQLEQAVAQALFVPKTKLPTNFS